MMKMWRSLLGLALTTTALATTRVAAGDETLCAIAPGTYAAAKASNPDMAFAIAELEKHAVATWYSDRYSDPQGVAKRLVATCPPSSRMTVVVYGLPNKDCEAKESSGGSNSNSAQYQTFVSNLQQTVGDRKVLYIVEPDAVALLAHGGCAKSLGYQQNLEIAVKTLSQNPNADIYVDVGHWMLEGGSDLSNVASIVRGLAGVGRVKGITINTSNYRPNSELSRLCGNFRGATSGLDLHCILDTSRNYNGASSQSEWCNYKNAGIGSVPTGNTGDDNVDYYVWIKPPGESDGTCAGRTSDAMTGPAAGTFSPNFMKQLWNNGALVKDHGMPAIDGTVRQVQPATSAPSPTTPTPTRTPSATPTPTPTPSVVNDTEQSANSTASETRSMDLVADNTTAAPKDTTSSSTSSSVGSIAADESAEVATGTVVAPVEKQPVFQNTPVPSTETPAGKVQEANTKSSAGNSVSAGIVVLGCLIGAAVVALVAVVAVRMRQRSIEETKSPLDPRIHYLSNSPRGLSTL